MPVCSRQFFVVPWLVCGVLALSVPRGAVSAQVPVRGAYDVKDEGRLAPATGYSGKLRALLVPLAARADNSGGPLPGSEDRRVRFSLPGFRSLWARIRGDSLGHSDSLDAETAELLMLAAAEEEDVVPIPVLPFGIKQGTRIGNYALGMWPAEARAARSTAYEVPQGFIEVGRDLVNHPVSEHFTLGQFLTHDQAEVWPKYLVLRAPLIDKLELVLVALQQAGYQAERLSVLSGFRTPQYNRRLVGRGAGAAAESRHQYGDASDVYVDNGDGRMADLNRDGKRDIADARVVASAVEAVEAAYPELVGGVGVYPALGPHGAFVHIDVRGERARWEGRTPARRTKMSSARRRRLEAQRARSKRTSLVKGKAARATKGSAASVTRNARASAVASKASRPVTSAKKSAGAKLTRKTGPKSGAKSSAKSSGKGRVSAKPKRTAKARSAKKPSRPSTR